MQRIIAATDLSPRGAMAVARAALVVRDHGAQLTLVHVVDEALPATLSRAYQLQAKALLDVDADRLATALRRDVDVEVVVGHDGLTLAERAAALDAHLVVVGPARDDDGGAGGLGTTTLRLLHGLEAPLLVVRQAGAAPYRSLLCAVDLADAARAVLGLAARLADDAPLHVLHVAPDPAGRSATDPATTVADPADTRALEALVAQAGIADQVTSTLVRVGRIDAVLPKVAEETGADLVVMGTTAQRRGRIARWLTGSHAEQALQALGCDVLVVPLAA